ncbi:MAG: polysaccharide biosynthesis tyrosine autokinase [Bacteroidota bacterium]
MGKASAGLTGGIDIKRVLNKYLGNWYLFLFAFIIAYFFAMYKNRYVIPVYKQSTSVLIEDKSNKSVLDQRGSISADPLFLNSKLIDNQIAILKSFSQIRHILENLNFQVSYFAKGKYVWEEIYKRAPFLVSFNKSHKQPKTIMFNLKLTGPGKFQIWSDDYPPFKEPKTFMFGDTVESNEYSFSVALKDSINAQDYTSQVYGFIINDINQLAGQYRDKTVIEPEKQTSVIIISSSGPNKEKEKDYLNELTRMFLTSNLEKKNRILISTIEFINSQLLQMGKDLDSAEQRLEEFRKVNKFMQLSAKAAMLLSEMNNESKSRAGLMADLKYYEYLLDYLQTRNSYSDIVMPSTVGLSLPLFSDLVLKLSTVSLEKEDLVANSSRQNPYIQTLEEQIVNMKTALLENMQSIIQTTKIKIKDTDERLGKKDAEFATLPGIERQYLEIERKYNVFNNLYDFLLKRKSEVEIQLAANSSDHEIVDYAGDTGVMVISASPTTAFINAFIWALLLPAVFLFVVVLFNNRIMSTDDIEAITDVPIIGTLIRNTDKRTGKILLQANSFFTEILRIIKIKLNLDPRSGEQVIMITSSINGDGKTFLAINLASIYALAGKRTLLLGFDLQRPKIAESFNLSGNEGVTNFLINDIPVDQVIQKTYTKNLDILLSGPVPPNPDELIESEKNRLLFAELRKRYDFIVMDTPPIGIVGDAFLLNRFADVTLFVTRYNHSDKKMFAKSIAEAIENKMKRIHIVFTDFKQKIKIAGNDLSAELGRKSIIPGIFIGVRKSIIELIRKF